MAAALFRELCRQRGLGDVEVQSAGTDAMPGQSTSPQACSALRAQRIPAETRPSRPLTRSPVAAADVIIAMTGSQQERIEAAYPEAQGKIQTMKSVSGDFGDIPDPYGGPLSEYIACLGSMRPCLERLADWVAEQRPAAGGRE